MRRYSAQFKIPLGQMFLLSILHLQDTTYPKDFKIYKYVQTSLFVGSKKDTITAMHNNIHSKTKD
jgi:hypothetical protein